MGKTLQHTWLPLTLLTMAIAAVFFLDTFAPLGVPIYILYIPVLIAAALCLPSRTTWTLCALCAILTAVSAFISPYLIEEQHKWFAVASQLASIPVMLLIIWLTVTLHQSRAAIRAAHASLQRSTEQLRQFVEQAPAAVAMFDREMRYLAHSRRWSQLVAENYGSAQNLVGTLHYTEIPDYPERWKEAHRRALAGEIVRCENDAVVFPDGREEVARWETIPWYNHSGQVGGVLLFVEQITERAQIERQLRDSEALYRSLVEHIPRGVFRKDLEGRYTFANRLYCEMLGKPLDAILRTTDDEHFSQELAAKHRSESRQVIETGCELNNVEEHTSPDRPSRYIRIVKTRLVDGDGHVIGTQGIAWDITEYHLERESLRHVASEFRTLAENLPDVIARYDRQFRHVYVNRAIERLTGIPVEAFLGRTHPEIGISDELVQQFLAAQQRVFDTGESQQFESVVHSLQGPRHFECRLVPEFAADGTVESILGISRDETDRMRAMEQSELHLAELAHATRLSTIGGLVSEIAHEINQPLHAIVNFAQASINVLEKTPLNHRPNLFAWLRQISEQANRAAEIIRRAGRFARKAPIRRSTVDVNALVRDCLNLLNFDLRLHHVKLECEFAENLPPLVADTLQIQQVVINLARNSVDAMSENDEHDRQLLVRTNMAAESVEISVCDNGKGLDAETRAKLFEPFFTTKPEGLGLGLAVCQSIVQAHEGRLWAEPNPERGTTFHFTLPANKEEYQDVYSLA